MRVNIVEFTSNVSVLKGDHGKNRENTNPDVHTLESQTLKRCRFHGSAHKSAPFRPLMYQRLRRSSMVIIPQSPSRFCVVLFRSFEAQPLWRDDLHKRRKLFHHHRQARRLGESCRHLVRVPDYRAAALSVTRTTATFTFAAGRSTRDGKHHAIHGFSNREGIIVAPL